MAGDLRAVLAAFGEVAGRDMWPSPASTGSGRCITHAAGSRSPWLSTVSTSGLFSAFKRAL